MSETFHVSASPHIRARATTGSIMLTVLVGLLPPAVFGILHFGVEALVTVLVTVVSAVASEYLYEKFMKKRITILDGSAAVTGLLLALNLPPGAPWWMCVLGAFFAIVVVKQLFGGLGQNIMNPALAARCFLLISFAGRMTDFAYHGVSGATPLAQLKAGEDVNTLQMLLGNVPGTIGETSVLAVMAGAIFLLMMGVIDICIPGIYLLVFSVMIVLFGGRGFDINYLTAHLCGGGLMLGAWFMATDYVTAPITKKGQVVYGVFLGVLTAVFRLFGNSSEGVSYAIIFSNLLVPLIDKVTMPKPFGKGGER